MPSKGKPHVFEGGGGGCNIQPEKGAKDKKGVCFRKIFKKPRNTAASLARALPSPLVADISSQVFISMDSAVQILSKSALCLTKQSHSDLGVTQPGIWKIVQSKVGLSSGNRVVKLVLAKAEIPETLFSL